MERKNLNPLWKRWLRKLANRITKKAYGISYMGIVSKHAMKQIDIDALELQVKNQKNYIEDLIKQIGVEKNKKRQKEDLTIKKQKKIDHLKSQIEHLEKLNSGAEDAIRSLQEDISQMCQMFDDERVEFRRVIKCLRENVRARNIKINKLKAGVNVPAEIKRSTERIASLSMKLAREHKEKYDLKKRLQAAIKYIKAKAETSGNDEEVKLVMKHLTARQ